ncbi:MAG: GH1 family beta-glucosidase [Aggregatilineales bacterium]
MNFPLDFVWGAATASYQIEGAAREDGRGECIWTRFSHTDGKVKGAHTGDIACDHYHRYADDVALMAQLGLRAYRFSIAWPRLLPEGAGAPNQAGLDFYSRLIDKLLEAGITPFATLYHWDLPQRLEDRGGWTSAEMPEWFAEYTALCAKHYGDRLKHWITLNEPWCTAFLGYYLGIHAPGLRDERAAFRAAHHTHLAHGRAMQVLRQMLPGAQLGITLNLAPVQPLTDSPSDVQAAQVFDGLQNRWFLDPVFKGCYPADVVAVLAQRHVLDGLDLDAVRLAAQPLDFLGVNYYTRQIVRHDLDDPQGFAVVPPENVPVTDMRWEIYPQGLRDLLLRVHQEYAPPAIYITENGAAFPEPEHVEGDLLDDPQRVAYLQSHFRAAAEALAHGVPLKGYFVWSLLDNFEWAEGYTKRFGIVHVDFNTQRRTLKRSALYFKQVIQAGALS